MIKMRSERVDRRVGRLDPGDRLLPSPVQIGVQEADLRLARGPPGVHEAPDDRRADHRDGQRQEDERLRERLAPDPVDQARRPASPSPTAPAVPTTSQMMLLRMASTSRAGEDEAPRSSSGAPGSVKLATIVADRRADEVDDQQDDRRTDEDPRPDAPSQRMPSMSVAALARMKSAQMPPMPTARATTAMIRPCRGVGSRPPSRIGGAGRLPDQFVAGTRTTGAGPSGSRMTGGRSPATTTTAAPATPASRAPRIARARRSDPARSPARPSLSWCSFDERDRAPAGRPAPGRYSGSVARDRGMCLGVGWRYSVGQARLDLGKDGLGVLAVLLDPLDHPGVDDLPRLGRHARHARRSAGGRASASDLGQIGPWVGRVPLERHGLVRRDEAARLDPVAGRLRRARTTGAGPEPLDGR